MQWNGTSPCEFDGKSLETETKTWAEFPNGGKAIVEQILALEEINKSKRAGLWGKLSVYYPSWWWTLKSPKTNTFADGAIERTSSKLDEKE